MRDTQKTAAVYFQQTFFITVTINTLDQLVQIWRAYSLRCVKNIDLNSMQFFLICLLIFVLKKVNKHILKNTLQFLSKHFSFLLHLNVTS